MRLTLDFGNDTPSAFGKGVSPHAPINFQDIFDMLMFLRKIYADKASGVETLRLILMLCMYSPRLLVYTSLYNFLRFEDQEEWNVEQFVKLVDLFAQVEEESMKKG